MTSSNYTTFRTLVSIMNSSDRTGFVARLKNTALHRHGRILTRRDHISPVDEVGQDDNGSEIEVMESTGLDSVGRNANLRRVIVNARYKP